MERIGRIFKFMKQHELDCIAIKDICTIRYLTGFTGDSSILYADDRIAVLITDGRYTDQARSQVKYCRVLEYRANHNNSIWEAVAELIGTHQKVGFDGDAYSYEDARVLKSLLPESTEMVSVNLRGMRLIKDERELESLWQAFKIADGAFERLLKEIKSGMTEKELAARLEYYMRSLGSEGVSFDTIVASGHRSALPHGAPTDKKIEVGDFVTFDFGALYNGYHSDTTRTVVMGMANSWHREIYTVVQEAQYRGIKAARPGITGKELDGMIREYIESRGYGKYFTHGLGHGVGLEIHELPNINSRGDIVLQEGMVFTVEPGVYIQGKGGVRIEDTVVLTKDGARSLTGLKKTLTEIV
ncbi:MAG: aminopeptidase P family protein [Acidaminococcaceae bacterium]|nr:aminopeptidase P family protein [Acidaminococcaceae bacterium]